MTSIRRLGTSKFLRLLGCLGSVSHAMLSSRSTFASIVDARTSTLSHLTEILARTSFPTPINHAEADRCTMHLCSARAHDGLPRTCLRRKNCVGVLSWRGAISIEDAPCDLIISRADSRTRPALSIVIVNRHGVGMPYPLRFPERSEQPSVFLQRALPPPNFG